MACVKEDQTKEGTHAFTDELDQQFSGSSMGTRSFVASRSAESTRTRLHCGSGVEHRASRGGEDGVDLCGVPRHGQRAVQSSGLQRAGSRPAQDTLGIAAAPQRVAHQSFAGADATTGLASGHRLALGAVLRRTGVEPQRIVPLQSASGDHNVSRLRHGLHRGVRPTLHVGAELGAEARIADSGAAAVAGLHAGNRAENQAFAARWLLLPRRRHRVAATGEDAVLDAGRDARAQAEAPSSAHGAAVNRAAKSRLVHASHGAWEGHGRDVNLCVVSDVLPPWREKTPHPETAVCGVARDGDTNGDSGALPQTIRHRNELSPTAASAYLHLHTQSAPAAAIRGYLAAAEKSVDLDSRDAPQRRIR